MRMSVDGRVVNPHVDEDAKTVKKNNPSEIHDSLLLILPKLEGKKYAHLIEDKNNLRRKRYWKKKIQTIKDKNYKHSKWF